MYTNVWLSFGNNGNLMIMLENHGNLGNHWEIIVFYNLANTIFISDLPSG